MTEEQCHNENCCILTMCRSHGIKPDTGPIDNPEVKRWASNEPETGVLPDFDLCFEKVRRIYRGLPWHRS